MGLIKRIDIKNRTYYFYNDSIDLKHFDAGLLKIDEKLYKDIGIYNNGYITKKKILLMIVLMRMYILMKKVKINIWFLILQMKIKSSLKNAMELEIRSNK